MGRTKRWKLSVASDPGVISAESCPLATKVTLKVIRWFSTDTDGERDTKGQWRGYKRTGTGTQTDRGTDGQGLGHRRTGTGAQADRDMDTDGQWERQGHRLAGRGAQTDRESVRDTGGQGQGNRRAETGIGTQMDKDRDTDGQRLRRTGIGTQTNRNRDIGGQDTDTGRQGQGHKRTRKEGKGHKRTRTGKRTWTWTIFTDNLQYNKSVGLISFKILQNWVLSVDAYFKFKK